MQQLDSQGVELPKIGKGQDFMELLQKFLKSRVVGKDANWDIMLTMPKP
jgi:hypothetical protein